VYNGGITGSGYGCTHLNSLYEIYLQTSSNLSETLKWRVWHLCRKNVFLLYLIEDKLLPSVL